MNSYRAIKDFLEERVFPVVVLYATHPFVIMLTVLFIFPLVLDAANVSLSLALGNYTNVVSASVSSIVLAKAIKSDMENRRLHEQHTQDIAALQQSHEGIHAKLDTLMAPTAEGEPHASQ